MPEEQEIKELLAREQRVKYLWSLIYPRIEPELANIWTDELGGKFKKLEKEELRIKLILQHLKSHCEKDIEIYPQTISVVDEIIDNIDNMKSSENWLIEIHNELNEFFKDVDIIGAKWRLSHNQLNERLKQFVRVFPGGMLKDIYLPPSYKPLNLLNDGDLRPAMVYTGHEAIVKKEREILTANLMGCVGVFIFGLNGKALLHMTPKPERTKLAYENPYLENSIRFIMIWTIAVGSPKGYIVTIISNMYGKDQYKIELGKCKAIETEFKKYGVKKIKILELPLVQTTLYHSQINSEHIFAIGKGTYLGKDGSLKDKNRIEVYKIPINPKVKVDFGIKRPKS